MSACLFLSVVYQRENILQQAKAFSQCIPSLFTAEQSTQLQAHLPKKDCKSQKKLALADMYV
jgi:hypothetical protein